MSYPALKIKKWIISELNPDAWSSIISRALPKLIQSNSSFNCFNITKRTSWTQEEFDIIASHLAEIHGKSVPTEVLSQKPPSLSITRKFRGFSFLRN